MAVLEGGVSGALQEVDAAHLAGRQSLWPIPAVAWNSFALRSGLLTGVAADAPVLSFRNLSSNQILVRKVQLGFVTTTAFSAAQMLDFGLYVARAFTVSDSAGLAVTLTGDTSSHRASLAPLTSADLRIADAAALTAGTRTLDAARIGQVAGWSGAVGESIPKQVLFEPTSYPLIIAQNEGFVINALTAMGAAGIGRLYVDVELAEVQSF